MGYHVKIVHSTDDDSGMKWELSYSEFVDECEKFVNSANSQWVHASKWVFLTHPEEPPNDPTSCNKWCSVDIILFFFVVAGFEFFETVTKFKKETLITSE